jgi:hypothetical protein
LSKGDGAITKKEAEVERDRFLAKMNAATVETAVQQVAATGALERSGKDVRRRLSGPDEPNFKADPG